MSDLNYLDEARASMQLYYEDVPPSARTSAETRLLESIAESLVAIASCLDVIARKKIS